MLVMPTHPDDVDAADRALTTWQARGPKWQPFGQRDRALAALRHADGRVKIATVPAGMKAEDLAGEGWKVINVSQAIA
jgi:hypothetical protein